ncbi:unnamed protein product [Urochloa humidicola]
MNSPHDFVKGRTRLPCNSNWFDHSAFLLALLLEHFLQPCDLSHIRLPGSENCGRTNWALNGVETSHVDQQLQPEGSTRGHSNWSIEDYKCISSWQPRN